MASTISLVGTLGLGDFTRVDTTAKYPLGMTVQANDGTEYTYVKAGEALAAKKFFRLADQDSPFDGVLYTDSDESVCVDGCTNVAIASGSYGWVITKGVVEGAFILSSAVAAKDLLKPHTVDGQLTLAANTDIVTGKNIRCLVDDTGDLGTVMIY